MKKWIAGFLAVFLITAPALAMEVGGVSVPEQVKLNGQEINLNGAGIRTKFFFDIYAGALYLPKVARDAKKAISMQGAKRVSMHFIHSEVSKGKLVDGWESGFKKNLSKEAREKLQERLGQFNDMFSDVKSGDVVLLDYLPEQGTRVTVRGDIKGTIPGKDFNEALLAVWLGKKPADKDLKESMLSGEN
ncbi:MAG: chalcone isomerase family protein [Mariprofundaceae bacterium]